MFKIVSEHHRIVAFGKRLYNDKNRIEDLRRSRDGIEATQMLP